MLAMIPYYQVPVFQIGPLPIHGFGLLVALGFMFGGQVAAWRARRSGLDGAAIDRVLTWLVFGTFIGGHWGYGLMYEREAYFADPVLFLQFWKGLSSMGGFLVCVPLAFYFFHKYKLTIWPYVDSLGIGLALGWFLGRMACTVAHDHPGTPSNFFLAKYCRPVEGHTIELPSFMIDSATHDLRWGPCVDGGSPVYSITDQVPADFTGVVAAHDMGFYEALWSLSVFFLFLWLDRKPRKPGFFICLLGVLYGPARWWMDTLRPESTDNRWFAGTFIEMTPGQFWALAFFLVSLYGLVMRMRSSDRKMGPSAPLTLEEGGYDPVTGKNGMGPAKAAS